MRMERERQRETEIERECRATISTACAAKFTKSFLCKYAAITRKADWCIRLCVFWQRGRPPHRHCLIISQLPWETNGQGQLCWVGGGFTHAKDKTWWHSLRHGSAPLEIEKDPGLLFVVRSPQKKIALADGWKVSIQSYFQPLQKVTVKQRGQKAPGGCWLQPQGVTWWYCHRQQLQCEFYLNPHPLDAANTSNKSF